MFSDWFPVYLKTPQHGHRRVHPLPCNEFVSLPSENTAVAVVSFGSFTKLLTRLRWRSPLAAVYVVWSVFVIYAYFIMFFLAYFRAASGVALPVVAISNAAFIELQNLPI